MPINCGNRLVGRIPFEVGADLAPSNVETMNGGEAPAHGVRNYDAKEPSGARLRLIGEHPAMMAHLVPGVGSAEL